MGRVVLWTSFTVFFFALLQAAILSNLAFLPALPDLVLLVIVYVSFMNSTATGTTTGFISGILLDFLSASPVGLNAFTKTLIGYITGKFSGSFNLDRILTPAIMGFSATVMKALITWVLSFFFGPDLVVYRLTGSVFWVEAILNAVCAPLVFALLARFPALFVRDLRNGE